MINHDLQWLSKKELECLLKVAELEESDVVQFTEDDPQHYKVNVDVVGTFDIPEGKKLILVSYTDTKREFDLIYDVISYFKDNPYLRNTVHKDGDNEYKKVRSRFFIVPQEFSKFCMLLIGRMCHPDFQDISINDVVEQLKAEIAEQDEEKKYKSHEVRDKIEEDLN